MVDLRSAFELSSRWLERQGITIETVIGSLALLVVGCGVIGVIQRLMSRIPFQGRLNIPYETVLIVRRLVAGLLWGALGLLLLNFWGVAVSGVWTVLVSTAAVIGAGFLATWAMISNVTASLFISIWRPFHLGTTVELIPENVTGRVIERNMMFTVLRETSGAALHVPNNLFFQKLFRVSGQYESYLYEEIEGKHSRLKKTEPTMEMQ